MKKLKINNKLYGVSIDLETLEIYGEKQNIAELEDVITNLQTMAGKNNGLRIGAIRQMACLIHTGIEVYADINEIDIDITEKVVRRAIVDNFETMMPEVTEILSKSFLTESEVKQNKKPDANEKK